MRNKNGLYIVMHMSSNDINPEKKNIIRNIINRTRFITIPVYSISTNITTRKCDFFNGCICYVWVIVFFSNHVCFITFCCMIMINPLMTADFTCLFINLKYR